MGHSMKQRCFHKVVHFLPRQRDQSWILYWLGSCWSHKLPASYAQHIPVLHHTGLQYRSWVLMWINYGLREWYYTKWGAYRLNRCCTKQGWKAEGGLSQEKRMQWQPLTRQSNALCLCRALAKASPVTRGRWKHGHFMHNIMHKPIVPSDNLSHWDPKTTQNKNKKRNKMYSRCIAFRTFSGAAPRPLQCAASNLLYGWVCVLWVNSTNGNRTIQVK